LKEKKEKIPEKEELEAQETSKKLRPNSLKIKKKRSQLKLKNKE